MEALSLSKLLVGTAGMAVGATLVSLIQIAAVDGAESARLQHLADIAAGRTPTPRVVVRSADLECPNVAVNRAADPQ